MDKKESKRQAQVNEDREGEAIVTGSPVGPDKGQAYAALQLSKSPISSTDNNTNLCVSFSRIYSKWERYLSDRYVYY